MEPTRILFIDSYDSFTYNVVRLIEEQGTEDAPVEVTVIHNDTFADIDDLVKYLPLFKGVVVGPGPGNPVNGSADVGVIDALFHDVRMESVPVLGICLGFQAMCYSLGASVEVLDVIKHGQVYPIHLDLHGQEHIFDGYPSEFKSTRYHSLHVTDYTTVKDVVPLAYTEDENGGLLMAARSATKPWFGVQYHPESCCSELGAKLVQNFLKIAETAVRDTSDTSHLSAQDHARLLKLQKTIDLSPIYPKSALNNPSTSLTLETYDVSKDPNLTFKICDSITEDKFIMASSAVSANRGEWSIIAVPSKTSKVFTHYGSLQKTTIYKWQDELVTVEKLADALNTPEVVDDDSISTVNEDKEAFWHTLGAVMKANSVSQYHDIPFVGGLVGIRGYEMGSYIHFDKDVENETGLPKPDAKLVYIESCIVINHQQGTLYTISLSGAFPSHITNIVKGIVADSTDMTLAWEQILPQEITYDITMPDKADYMHAFDKCQEYMHKGDSYEMCLTTQTVVKPSQRLAAWRIFKTLITRNPAPFSSFFHFNDIVDNSGNVLSFISTSPERFLKWDGDSCELRPIKGTVKKSPEMTRDKATEILKSPKEFGENLMILDLIRNDLYELLPDVRVEEFMSVEEYKTVYQLVSVVKAYSIAESNYSGIDVLKYSLPPGSMTGAPKKITVELLQDEIERKLNHHVNNGARGMYSGVTGYWSANGNGDWSVNIRCMYSYDSGDTWQLGAGGAITVLSTQEGELDEMYTKLESALQVFM